MERRICFIHNWVSDIPSFLKYTDLSLNPNITLIWDDTNPEILFGTDNIYTTQKCNDKFRALYNKAKIVVYFGSEASFTDFNLFDYGIGFDNTINSERYVQLPVERFFKRMFKNEPISQEEKTSLHASEKRFCNFMYSNPNAHPVRDKLFFEISKYKHVDSLGSHLNNTGLGGTGFVGHYEDMVNLKRGYKFSIACENSEFPGYTSEKIYTSLNARTVPIYWGNPDVELEINPQCFINCMKLGTVDAVIEEIKRIDSNSDLWYEMIMAPWHTQEQSVYIANRSALYDSFFDKLFSDSLDLLKQRRIGTYQYYYRSWFLQTKIDNSIFSRIKRRLAREKGNQVKIF